MGSIVTVRVSSMEHTEPGICLLDETNLVPTADELDRLEAEELA